MQLNNLFNRITHWQQHVSKKQFTFLMAVAVGASAGLVAVILKMAVHFLFTLVTTTAFSDNFYLLLSLPLIGIALTYGVIQKGLNGTFVKGLASLHFAIAQNKSNVAPQQMYAQLLTSAITVGLGGSAGLEAPIVLTGAAFGSNYARAFQLSHADRSLLLACGVAAGIASAFNAPIAGVLFTIEVLLLEISTSGFIPLLIASACGALMSKIVLNEGTLLTFQLQQPFNSKNVPFYLLLGVLAGLLSVYHGRMFVKVEHFFNRFKGKPYQRILYAGLSLALLIAFFPSLFGEGYSSIKSLALMQPADLFHKSLVRSWMQDEWSLILFIGIVMLLKVVATSITLSGGGNGGNFAPSLFVGAYLGFVYARLINLLHISTISESNFTIVGMAGVLSGVYHAPLTAIFLIAELTGGYALMIPLMIVAAFSYLTSKSLEPYSMDTKQLALAKKILSSNKDNNILIHMDTQSMIETDFVVLQETDSLEQLVQAIIASKRNIFPVVDVSNQLQGVIFLNDVKDKVFQHPLDAQLQMKDILMPQTDLIQLTDDVATVVAKFERSKAWNLPVVDAQGYIGFISKSQLFSAYRSELINKSIE